MKSKIQFSLLLFFWTTINLNGQILEITHQSNGTTLSVPIQSIDSVKFQMVPPPILKKIYQNNGNILGVSINDIDSITYNIPNTLDLPILTTSQATVLSPTTAFGGGVITSEGSAPVTQRGVCWSLTPNPSLANNFTNDGIGIGTFSSSIYPLNPSTTYYIRAYATNSFGTAYGNTYVITTNNAANSGSIPTVTTSTVFYTDGLSASCGGDITGDGGLAVLARGVCWAVGVTPTINNSLTIDGAGAGSFASVLTNLQPNTSYFVRAYATNDAGTAYGITYNFTTNELPIVVTDSVSNVTTGSGNISGTVQSSSSSPIIARGICWSFNPQPTLNDNIITSGTGNGSFNKNIVGLLNSTTCYARAYATNGMGTSYGSVVSFTTSTFSATIGQGVIFDGYNYQTVVYGNGQEWFAENLRTTMYANGDPIPNIIDDNVWYYSTNGAWSHYSHNSQYDNPYGKIYNGFAVLDSRNVCPSGWHLPTVSDFTNLINYLGGPIVSSDKMRVVGTQYWAGPNTNASNESLFSAYPGGFRLGYIYPSPFDNLGTSAWFWTTGSYSVFELGGFNWENNNGGCSVRCIKN
jgi:uncharacterized protein (TIGR02145 family)